MSEIFAEYLTFYLHQSHIHDEAWIGHPHVLQYKQQMQISQS
jgi:hypothetical protein